MKQNQLINETLPQVLAICGLIAPLLLIFTAILGGIIRPEYSHISDTVSELFSPGSPNKLLLDTFYTAYALIFTLFGIGVLIFVQKSEPPRGTGMVGASLLITVGLLSVPSAIFFPQDAWGSPPTFPGEMHKIVHGVIGLLSILYMFLIAIWGYQTKIFPGLRIYTLVTIILVFLASRLFVTTMGFPIMGLTERFLILVGFQWTFTLALKMTALYRLNNRNQRSSF